MQSPDTNEPHNTASHIHRSIQLRTLPEELCGTNVPVVVMFPQLEKLSIQSGGLLSVQPLQFSFRQEPGLHGDGSGFLVQLLEEEVKWHRSSGIHPGVDPVVPTFQIVVGPDRSHKHTPVPHSKCRTLKPLPPHISHESG